MDKDTGCFIMVVAFVIVLVLSIIFPTRNKQKSEKHVAAPVDSLATGEYVIIAHKDKLYHRSLDCSLLGSFPEITTDREARKEGKFICHECIDRESVFSGYLDGEYISIEECEDNH